jgi:hypothetical protein
VNICVNKMLVFVIEATRVFPEVGTEFLYNILNRFTTNDCGVVSHRTSPVSVLLFGIRVSEKLGIS